MKPRMCKVKHNPPHTYGDCIAACIRTMTDDDQVPHVFRDGFGSPEESWANMRAYLKTKGKTLTLIPVDDPYEFMEINNHGSTYMLLCSTSSGNHAVVCKSGVVVADPAWYKEEIKGPLDNGLWIIGLIGDAV